MLCIKQGSHFSDFFGVPNGVRQGGALSLYLFALYFNELSTNLNAIKSGCIIVNALVKNFFFADICLLPPRLSGLQDLVDVWSSYAVPHNIVFNCKKSVGVLVLSKGFVVVALIYPPVTGQRQTLTYWTIRTLFITTTTS